MFRFPGQKPVLIMVMVCLVLGVVFAEAQGLELPGHHCSGEGCPVCLQIGIAQNLLKALGFLCLIFAASGFYAVLLRVKGAGVFYRAVVPSPVLLKVKNNT